MASSSHPGVARAEISDTPVSPSPKGLKPFLDHMVLLLPYDQLTDLPRWIPGAFNVLPGGRHAGGATENKLIVFEDGSYFELIAFLSDDSDSRDSSPWAKRRPGQFIDWACSLGEEPGEGKSRFPEIQGRVQAARTGLVYSDLSPGGRTKPDGVEIKWSISTPQLDRACSPDYKLVGGEAPFWCLDETPRGLRVPVERDNTKHECGATGVAGLTVFVKDEALFRSLHGFYDALLDWPGKSTAVGGLPAYWWELRSLISTLPDVTRRRLIIVHVGESNAVEDEATSIGAKGHDLHIRIALFSAKGPGKLAGDVGKGSTIEFDLVSPEDT